MQTKNLIQASANVIKITNLEKGDVFKQIDDTYSTNETYFGVVLDLLSTGERTFITVLRYKRAYGCIESSIQTYAGDQDLNLFPALVGEVESYLSETIEIQEKSIRDDKKKLQNKIDALEKAKEFVSGELTKKLTQVSWIEITQEEFEQKKLEKQQLLEKINDE